MQPKPDNSGRKDDFAEIAARAYPALSRAATVLCWSQSDVDDVVQETMLSAFKSYDSFRGNSSFVTWAYRILARTAYATNRRHARIVPIEEDADQTRTLPPVDRAVMLDEDARLLIDAIRSLPQRQREIVTLHFLENVSYAQIAAALDISPGTVKATIFEARSSLRAALARKGILRSTMHELS